MSRRYKSRDDEKLIGWYKQATGIHDPCMLEVAIWAKGKQYGNMPKPKSDVELLAKRLSRSARQATREDDETGLFYRSNLAYQVVEGGETKVRWFDPDDSTATRGKMEKARTLRREQMVGDAFQYAVDTNRWNRKHPNDAQLPLDLDFGPDVMWRLAGLAAERKKAS